MHEKVLEMIFPCIDSQNFFGNLKMKKNFKNKKSKKVLGNVFSMYEKVLGMFFPCIGFPKNFGNLKIKKKFQKLKNPKKVLGMFFHV